MYRSCTHIATGTPTLDGLFAPDLYNFVPLMNLDGHVHLHMISCYGSTRGRRKGTFSDPHHDSRFGTEERLITEETLGSLAGTLKGRL